MNGLKIEETHLPNLLQSSWGNGRPPWPERGERWVQCTSELQKGERGHNEEPFTTRTTSKQSAIQWGIPHLHLYSTTKQLIIPYRTSLRDWSTQKSQRKFWPCKQLMATLYPLKLTRGLWTYCEKHKILLVVLPNTVIDPGTVVVHFPYAAFANTVKEATSLWWRKLIKKNKNRLCLSYQQQQ